MNDNVDMSQFVEAKSDQLNSDDLLGAPRTITVRKVTGAEGDQPVSIYYEGDNNKPFKPCKTMRRVLLGVWGRYASDYVGKSMTLYRDDEVSFGGLAVGGIRISHMSHIDKETVVVVLKSKGKKAGIKVLPMQAEQQTTGKTDDLGAWAHKFIAAVGRAPSLEKLDGYAATVTDKLTALETDIPEAHEACMSALSTKRASFAVADDDDPFAEPADPAATTLANIRESIAGCRKLAELATCETAWGKHRAAYDETTAASVDALIAETKRVIEGEGE